MQTAYLLILGWAEQHLVLTLFPQKVFLLIEEILTITHLSIIYFRGPPHPHTHKQNLLGISTNFLREKKEWKKKNQHFFTVLLLCQMNYPFEIFSVKTKMFHRLWFASYSINIIIIDFQFILFRSSMGTCNSRSNYSSLTFQLMEHIR